MALFLSCDWGTSSFRLKLAERETLTVLAEEISTEGIFHTWTLWKEKGENDPAKRQEFYLSVLSEHIRRMEVRLNSSLDDIPLIISGMASSSIGIIELPYAELPFNIAGSGIQGRPIPSDQNFKHDVFVISGIKSEDDVMRGEETQLVGCVSDPDELIGDTIFIFPGTHSKHIFIKDNTVTGFKTYMTGEFFELLSTKSILKDSLRENNKQSEADSAISFKQGVKDALGSSLLHTAFKVRTNFLFNKLSAEQNYNYLSGLLIGAELQDIANDPAEIYLCCNSNLLSFYQIAAAVSGITEKVHIFPVQRMDEAVLKGQIKIFNQYSNQQ